MNWQDVKNFTHNGYETMKNFFRVMFATVRGRELSSVDGGGSSEDEATIIATKLQQINAEIERTRTELSIYLKLPAEKQSSCKALELAINLRDAVKNAVLVCGELLKSNQDNDLSKDLQQELLNFETSEIKVAKIIDKLLLRAKRESLYDITEMFESEVITESLMELSKINPHYMQNFSAIESHLLQEEAIGDKREWLQVLGDQIALIFYSEFKEYSKIHDKSFSRSHLEGMISQRETSIESRQDILNLLHAINNLLLAYALDDEYKDVAITAQESPSDVPIPSTIGELSEHLNGWFKAFYNANKNAKIPVHEDKVDIVKTNTKPKKTVRFATDAVTYTNIVDEKPNEQDNISDIIGHRVGTEKIEFKDDIQGLVNSVKPKKPTRPNRRCGSTVTDNK